MQIITISFLWLLTAQSSPCDESFPTVQYLDHCYATLGGFDPYDTSVTCQYSYLPIPSGWRIPIASEEVYDAATAYPWGTNVLVFHPDSQGRLGCAGTSNNAPYWRGCQFYLTTSSNTYKPSQCNIAVLITKSATGYVKLCNLIFCFNG